MTTPEETRQQRDFKRKAAVARRVYPILAGTLVFILVLGTVVYHYVEGWSWVDAFYFSAVAGSTVGFGDLSPTTNGSKDWSPAPSLTCVTIAVLFQRQSAFRLAQLIIQAVRVNRTRRVRVQR